MSKIYGIPVTAPMHPEKSGGGMLPQVTAEDNGKFLQVAEGAWAAVDAVPRVNALVANCVSSRFVPLTQEEYDALETVDPDKYYMIVGDGA